MQPLLMALLAGMSRSQLADANTLFNVGQRLGGSLGVGLLATFFTVRVTTHVKAVLGAGAAGIGQGVGSLSAAPPALRARLADAAVAGFHDTIWVGVAVVALGLVCALFLRPGAIAANGVPYGGGSDGGGPPATETALTTAEPAA
jgi:hypothetical protein